MKENPTVCAIMLVNGREGMVKRAIKSFREQTYQDKTLYILDSGKVPMVEALPVSFPDFGILYHRTHPDARTIGELRNYAVQWTECDILCHWDSDDWSHPRRIEEQVALLQASGKQCVGYKDMLFYDTTPGQFCGAWLYRHATKPLGTSLCYWRSVWEARPFPDLPKVKGGTGEDVQWLEGVDQLAVSSVYADYGAMGLTMRQLANAKLYPLLEGKTPRMIASIHGGNTQYYKPVEMERLSEGTSWKRAAEFDEYCRKVMEL